jgi:hypothetical protein
VSTIDRIRSFLRTRNGKITAGAVGAGGVVAAGLYSRRSTGATGPGPDPAAAAPMFSGAAGGSAYDGTLSGAGGYANDGTGVDLMSVFADQVGSALSSITGAIDASAATQAQTNADMLAALEQLRTPTTAQVTSAGQTAAAAISGLIPSTTRVPSGADVSGFLTALATETNRRRAAGQSESEIEQWLKSVAAAGGADPNQITLPRPGLPGGAGAVTGRPPNVPFRSPGRLPWTTPAAAAPPVARTVITSPAARGGTGQATTGVPVAAPLMGTLAIRTRDAAAHRW